MTSIQEFKETLGEKSKGLTDEQLESLKELGGVLMQILCRLIFEGKAKIENGKVVFIKK